MELPDMKLASTYIPACWCVLKTIAFVALFLLLPVSEYAVVICLLLLDRISFNIKNLIIDVNAICQTAVVGLVINEHRHQEATPFAGVKHILIAALSLLTLIQMTKFTRLWFAVELTAVCVAIPVIIHVPMLQENYEIKCFRVLCFISANILTSYLSIYAHEMPPPYFVCACRTIVVMLADAYVFPVWYVGYMFVLIVCTHLATKSNEMMLKDEDYDTGKTCAGYNGSSVSKISAQTMHYANGMNAFGCTSSFSTTKPCGGPVSSSDHTIDGVSSDGADVKQLREALAKRSNFRV
jgi:hypothetical protein